MINKNLIAEVRSLTGLLTVDARVEGVTLMNKDCIKAIVSGASKTKKVSWSGYDRFVAETEPKKQTEEQGEKYIFTTSRVPVIP